MSRVKEIKKQEYRVGLTPDNVKAYVSAGNKVFIERDAGLGSGFATDEYEKAGTQLFRLFAFIGNSYKFHSFSGRLLRFSEAPGSN